jgi:hypothetical protein
MNYAICLVQVTAGVVEVNGVKSDIQDVGRLTGVRCSKYEGKVCFCVQSSYTNIGMLYAD